MARVTKRLNFRRFVRRVYDSGMVRRGLSLSAIVAVAALGCLEGPRHRHQQIHYATSPAPAPTPTQENVTTPMAPPASTKELELANANATITPAPTTMPTIASTTMITPDGPLDVPSGATPAIEYASMTAAQCEAELKKRAIPFANVATASGVDRPVRLTGKLHGVAFHGLEKNTATSLYEIIDCRLVLALDDFSAILAQHDVVEAIHFSIYRPEKKAKKTSKHAAALAIDLGTMIKKDGSKLSVEHDWHGGIGQKSCGASANAPVPKTKEATELREILCGAYDARLFNVLLTPNYNKPHYNHFHLEVTRGVKWYLLR
jgi:hypothetical protein